MARNVDDFNYVLDLFETKQVRKPKFVLLGMDLSLVLRDTFLDDTEWDPESPERWS